MNKILNFLKEPITLLTIFFVFLFTLFNLFQIEFFRFYINNHLESKIKNTFTLIENKLSDYIKFLENYYKIPFLPEFFELPESKGWLLDLVDYLEDLYKKEKLESVAIFYQKKLLLSWPYKGKNLAFSDCKNSIKIHNNLIEGTYSTQIENKNFCLYLSLDIFNYKQVIFKYLLITGFLYVITLIMVFYLFSKLYKSEQLKRKVERSLQAERELALLGKMAATLAHELRNSLNNLFLLLQVSKENFTTSFQKDLILKELNKLLNWTQDILLFQKNFRINPTYFEVDQLILELKLMFAPYLNEKISLEMEKKVETLWGDFFWLKKASENLLKNALETIKEGKIKTSFLKKEEWYLIEVYDSGDPIPKEIEEKIFEPFYTTKKEGFGLGLFLVKKILEAHKGSIEIENLSEGGKIFRLKWKEK